MNKKENSMTKLERQDNNLVRLSLKQHMNIFVKYIKRFKRRTFNNLNLNIEIVTCKNKI